MIEHVCDRIIFQQITIELESNATNGRVNWTFLNLWIDIKAFIMWVSVCDTISREYVDCVWRQFVVVCEWTAIVQRLYARAVRTFIIYLLRLAVWIEHNRNNYSNVRDKDIFNASFSEFLQ